MEHPPASLYTPEQKLAMARIRAAAETLRQAVREELTDPVRRGVALTTLDEVLLRCATAVLFQPAPPVVAGAPAD